MQRCSCTAASSRKWAWALCLVFATFYFLVYLSIESETRHDGLGLRTTQYSLNATQLKRLIIPTAHDDTQRDRRLRIFMPADSPHINLCKTIISAVALGYPLPTLLNWDGEFNRPEWPLAGTHIAKLESLLAVIEEMLSSQDGSEQDLAVLVDAYDIWFQLPPSVLIARYHQLNLEADERLRSQWMREHKSGSEFPVPPPKQSIIVTSAKDCHPGSESGSKPHYDHWPESPVRSDLYGDGTDHVLPLVLDPARKWKKIRPRCMNSGLIMGTMGALRDTLVRCKEKIEDVARAGRQIWSDQALLAEVMGDQQLWREWMLQMSKGWDGTISNITSSDTSSETRPIAKAALEGKRYEFGIGLDYRFATIPPTCSAEEDGGFINLNDQEAIQSKSIEAGVLDGVRVNGIPPELGQHRAHDDDPLCNISWGDVPLFTDFYFGNTPVGIHHNAYINGLKPWRLEHWWEKMWFHPYLRDLLQKNLRPGGPAWPLAQVLDNRGKEVAYWVPKSNEAKSITVFQAASSDSAAQLKEISWANACQKGSKPWGEKIFGDDKGPLKLFY